MSTIIGDSPQVCADTIVGSHTRRGISGGQKKRVTTGEVVVGPCKVLLMDEISVRSVNTYCGKGRSG